MNDIQFIPGFLIPREVYTLREIAAEITRAGEWASGRQGTGYEKHAIKARALNSMILDSVIRAACELLGVADDQTLNWDAYLLRYPEGTEIPSHTDPSPEAGYRHRRLNVIVSAPSSGGFFRVGDQDYAGSPGDAVLFHPDTTEHAVTRVYGGERLVLSVGALVRA